jgi:hypothetical protein
MLGELCPDPAGENFLYMKDNWRRAFYKNPANKLWNLFEAADKRRVRRDYGRVFP